MLFEPPPLALYVHLPWCVRKCPYCDFNSHAMPQNMPQREYIDALIEDLDHDLTKVRDRTLISIFFGGGTPSLFSPEEIGLLLEAVRARFVVSDELEVTLEANPGTIEHGRFAGYREAGVTRVSLGVQSFNEQQLKTLGRIHGAEDVHRAVDELRRAELDNFNLDLMYGLPQQSIEEALQDLRSAIELQPAHISHYQLTLEPGTVFYHRPPPLPDDDASWQMQTESQALLDRFGYSQYEISAYAQAGRQCRHNLNYWQFGDYLGIGAGAHGKLTVQDGIQRTARCKQPREYLSRADADRIVEHRWLSGTELPFEFMLNALRLRGGVPASLFQARTGLALDVMQSQLTAARAKGLLADTPERLAATELGLQFLNDLQAIFLPA